MSLEGWILSVNRIDLWVTGKFAEALWFLACLSFHHVCSLLFQVLLCCPFCPLLWQSCSCHHGWKHLSWMCCFFFFFFLMAQGALAPCVQEQPENRDTAYYRRYPFSRAGNCLLGSLNNSGASAPATVQPPCTLYPVIPLPTLLKPVNH